MRTGLAVAAIVMLGACQPAGEARVDHAWVRLAAVPGNPAAAYFTLHGGAKDETLTGVSTPDAAGADMHESTTQAGMASMAPLKLVALRAGGTVAFAPGGRHVMLYRLNPAVLASGTVPLTLTFASGRTLTTRARVVGAGDAAAE
ncbi:MAG: copper chaperone PCu(A)C [Sphingomonas sp.]|uniref:copper chaperone PCu(A)C n=1 Tax=Sphingomonas sp. TaxID=28214 RepID=UPI001AD13A7C|nr:copper chaperone PCu(A)C [Sphingomonas sp.]MBN8809545.1 copper chaperone PCu(A)C [Sphingomonas sp.]